jgi:hypothetical protein
MSSVIDSWWLYREREKDKDTRVLSVSGALSRLKALSIISL